MDMLAALSAFQKRHTGLGGLRRVQIKICRIADRRLRKASEISRHKFNTSYLADNDTQCYTKSEAGVRNGRFFFAAVGTTHTAGKIAE
jgi:hypothetical protein